MTRPTGTNLKNKSLAKETVTSIISGTDNTVKEEVCVTTIRLPKSLKNRITIQAKKKGITSSAFIKLVLSNELEKLEKE